MENSENIKENDPYNFLLLSLYFYLKKNNYNQTAQKLFQEGKLDSIFKFPQELKSPINEKEKMQNEFINFFYRNSFNNPNLDFLGDFWAQFWAIFANKMMNNNKVEALFDKEQKNIIKQTYTQNNISQNFINENLNKDNNLKSLNFSSNINKIMNNNNIGEPDDVINIINQKSYIWPEKEKNMNIEHNNPENKINKYNKSNSQINKNNQHYYDDEEDEDEGENDIEKEMDEANDIHFNKENGPNIIKQENGNELNNDVLGNEYENDMTKNMYTGFHNNNNSLSNLDFNALGGYSNSKLERNMSAIPLRKDVGMGNNNNNEFDI